MVLRRSSPQLEDSTLNTSIHPTERPAALTPLVPVNMFDISHVGVVLCVVLFVTVVTGVGTLFGAHDGLDWLLQFSALLGGVLPGALAWLIAVRVLKGSLNRLKVSDQWLAGVALGAVAGLQACGLLALAGLLERAQWGASGVAGALLAAVVLAGLFWRSKARAPAATAARLAELQSRIRPHFLFNTLNSAIALVRAEPAKAEAVLEDLCELFRHALADPAESVTLGQEIALAQRYLDIEQIRFGDRLRVQWHLDERALNARLPPLLLQPLVENAVRHGVEPSATGADLRISTRRRGDMVVISVTNSSPQGVGERGHGLALANVRDRLFLLHDMQAQFTTKFKNGMFQVRMEIPA